MQLVNFFLAGVQKGGTTALYAMLRRIPSIQMAQTKEVHHFDDETADWKDPDYTPLHAQFDWSVEAIRGEATPVYTYWPNALARIAAYNPAARIIICLRHPTHRAHSHWRMEVKRNADTLSFSDAIREGRDRVSQSPGGVHPVFSYVERGFYASQVRRALELFGRENTLFMRTDRMWGDAEGEFARICEFLGVTGGARSGRRYTVPLDTSEMNPIGPGDRSYLTRLYAEDIAATAALTGLDLADWLAPDYAEPMRHSGDDRPAASP